MSTHASPAVFVLGGTPAGIAAAVRAAREGLDVALATYNDALGGMLASGVCVSDTHFKRPRSPVYDEFVEGVRSHYRETYGADSDQYGNCKDGYLHEPRVAEKVFTELVDEENAVDVYWRYHPTAVERRGRRLKSVTLEPLDGGETRIVNEESRTDGEEPPTVEAETFVDATYEGDLAATAGVPYRLGRESRDEYGEQHAGRIFTHIESGGAYPQEAARGDLNIDPFPGISKEILSGSTGVGDDAVQTYNSRLTISDDPKNRRRPEKPDDYDRSRYLGIVESDAESAGKPYPMKGRVITDDPTEWSIGLPDAYPLPNDKRDWNSANFVGENYEYPEGDWETRREIAEAHHNHALGLLYFLQNDEAVPEEVREKAREWGLARDEYPENDNLPHQIYVREARRIEGRATFTEHDARVSPRIERPPVHDDAIAITDWVLDCHDVRPERKLGSEHEGDFFLTEVTRPGQVPYGSLLPEGLDNLLVPVALSASHVGFQTVRLEPAWTQIGEAAGMAAALASGRETTPGDLDPSRLQRALAERGSVLAFFNDVDAGTDAAWTAAVLYLGTKGFFPTFAARPEDPLDRETAEAWASAAADLATGTVDSMAVAREVQAADSDEADAVTGTEFRRLVTGALEDADVAGAGDVAAAAEAAGVKDADISRGTACEFVAEICMSQ